MLDTIGADRHGHVHRRQAVRVRGHRQAGGVRLPHHHPQFPEGELAQHHLGARRREPAADHDLHHIDAALGALLHSTPTTMISSGGRVSRRSELIVSLMDAASFCAGQTRPRRERAAAGDGTA